MQLIRVLFVCALNQWITSSFRDLSLPPFTVLDIPDEYEYMDPRLQAAPLRP